MEDMMDKKFEYIVFDLGGVMVELAAYEKMMEWMEHKITLEEFNKKWLLSNAVRSFESGKITPSEFANAIIEEFNLPVSEEEFIKGFMNFIKGFYDGMEDLLKKLSQNYTLACLSNTSELHWSKLCSEYDIESMIKHNFLSYKTGLNKPDKEAFLNVIRALGTEPDKIPYFDDNQINVDAARQVGMEAYRVCGCEEVCRVLEELKII